MAQANITLNCAVSGTVFTSNLNSALSAINSMHSGAAAPTLNVVDGKTWLDTSSTSYKMKLYRTVWHPLFEFTTSSAKLTVNEAAISGAASVGGTLSVTGNINNTSDRRVKDNLKEIEDPILKVLALTGYSYDRTDLEYVRQVGLIAQEVESVLPEAVSTREDGIKSLNYNSVIALLVEAIKAQQLEINELKERMKDVPIR